MNPALHRRNALTLIELVVVLLVLSILATVAVQSLTPVMDQTRFEATQRTLSNVRRAIVGSETYSANDAVTGYVADMGSPPSSLNDLFVQPMGAIPYAIQTAAAPHTDVRLPCGWRGPYLRLPAGATTPIDGWGQPIGFMLNGTDYVVTSTDAGRGLANPTYLGPITETISLNDYQSSSIVGKLYALSGDKTMRNPPSSATWAVNLLSPGASGIASTPAQVTTVSGTGEVTYSLANLTIGPHAVQAVKNGVAAGAPTYFTVRAGGALVIDLQVE